MRGLHLVHPAVVHVTVAFLTVGGLVEAFGIVRRKDAAERFGMVLVLVGTIALLPTLATGFLARNALALAPVAAAAVDRHERFGIMVLGVFLPLMLVRAWGRGRVPEGARVAYALGLLVGVALTVVVAFLGGRMVYELGVGVRS